MKTKYLAEQIPFTPQYLNRWQRPENYAGANWPDYFMSGVGQSRDSDALERANFDAMLKALGGEHCDKERTDPQDEDCALPIVRVIRENHWAVGWVEWIAIHESAADELIAADEIMRQLENYPVIDEYLWSEYEQADADEIWRNCFNPRQRIKFIRERRSHFEFRSMRDLIQSVRGKYFAGYPSDILG